MNKSEVLKFLNKYLDSQEVMYMQSIYQPKKVRRNVSRTDAQLRTITDGEIIIEYDCENPMRRYYLTRLAINRLKANGYNFVIWKAQNQKSPHIHVYDIKGLDKVSHKINREYKKLFLLKYGTSESDIHINTKSYQPIAIENKEHFKYGTLKDIVSINDNQGNLSNTIELQLLKEARENVLARQQTEDEVRHLTNNYDNSWFINWITNEELPKGKRDSVILKNLSILMEQGLVKEEDKVLEKLSNIYDNKIYSLVTQWRRWARNKYFSIGEIITFCADFGYDFGEVRQKYLNVQKDSVKESNDGDLFRVLKKARVSNVRRNNRKKLPEY